MPPSLDQDLGFSQGIEISMFKHSSLSLRLTLSLYPFSQGLPGSMKSVFTPSRPSHFRTAFAVSSGNAGKITAMLGQAAPYPRRPPHDLDVDPWLFNAANGTLVLAPPGGEISDDDPISRRAVTRDDLITKLAVAEHDPEATAPQFLKFLEQIMPDAGLQAFLQRIFGYCLTGDVSEQVLFVFFGAGSNGKSTLTEVIRDVIGDYCVTVPIQTFLHNDRRGGGDATPDLARLPGARLVLAAEPEVGDRLSESTVKTITGGERVAARHLYEKQFEFDPMFKLILSCNVKPNVRGQDKGIWRRILMVPFDQSFEAGEIDEHLKQKLRSERGGHPELAAGRLSGVAGNRPGRARPGAGRNGRLSQRKPIPSASLSRTCTIEHETARVRASELYQTYIAWCMAGALEPRSRTAFGRRMNDLRIERETVGVVFYRGIELRHDLEFLADDSGDGGQGDGE